jgi:membrane-associated protein
MRHRTFTTFNAVGALVWAVGIVTIGFYFGGIPFVARHIELITIGVAGVSIVPAAIQLLRGRGSARGSQDGESKNASSGALV